MKSILLIGIGAAAILGGAAAAQPRVDVPVAYRAATGTSSSIPMADGSVEIGGSRASSFIFSLTLRSRSAYGARADLLTPAGYHPNWLRAADVAADDAVGGPERSALELSIAHHRPAMLMHVDGFGRMVVEVSLAAERYQTCASRVIDADHRARPVQHNSAEQAAEAEDDASWPELLTREPALLLGVIQLSLPPGAGGRWVLSPEDETGPRATQYIWRSEQIRLHGRGVGLQFDTGARSGTPETALCRAVAVRDVGEPVSESCAIEGFVDARDGWPIVLSVTRTVQTAAGARSTGDTSFSRLAPLEGFQPPPNRCPARQG
jgi:hypothetical protein